MRNVRYQVANHIEPEHIFLDVACGTGSQTFEGAGKIQRGAGMDYSDSMIDKAKATCRKRKFTPLQFNMQDFSESWPLRDKEFDTTVL